MTDKHASWVGSANACRCAGCWPGHGMVPQPDPAPLWLTDIDNSVQSGPALHPFAAMYSQFMWNLVEPLKALARLRRAMVSIHPIVHLAGGQSEAHHSGVRISLRQIRWLGTACRSGKLRGHSNTQCSCWRAELQGSDTTDRVSSACFGNTRPCCG